MELTPKQAAWQAYKTARREAEPVKPTRATVVHAPKGSPIRAYRRAVAVVDRADLGSDITYKKLNRKVRKAIARGTRLARSRQNA
jgi:hypothetical protein